jgi:hypothetical protein
VRNPYEFIGFGAMDATKTYDFIGFGAMDATKTYEFIRFGAMVVSLGPWLSPNPMNLQGLAEVACR